MPAKTRRQVLEKMVADDPRDAFARYGLAMDYSGTGETDAAWRLFQDLMAHCPDYVPGYLQAGQLLVRMGRDDDARMVFRTGIEAARNQNDMHAAGEMQGFLDQIG